MQHFTQVIDGIDGSRAELVGYVIDNSPEMDPDRRRPAILIIPGGGTLSDPTVNPNRSRCNSSRPDIRRSY